MAHGENEKFCKFTLSNLPSLVADLDNNGIKAP